MLKEDLFNNQVLLQPLIISSILVILMCDSGFFFVRTINTDCITIENLVAISEAINLKHIPMFSRKFYKAAINEDK